MSYGFLASAVFETSERALAKAFAKGGFRKVTRPYRHD
jgi:hypothetical protein